MESFICAQDGEYSTDEDGGRRKGGSEDAQSGAGNISIMY